MPSWWEGGPAAFQLLLMMGAGWFVVFAIAGVLERRMRGQRRGARRRGPGLLAAAGWLWDYSNVIGIPTLLLGAAYLIWTMNWGPGLDSGPTMLIILLMMAAGFLVGFGPGLRR